MTASRCSLLVSAPTWLGGHAGLNPKGWDVEKWQTCILSYTRTMPIQPQKGVLSFFSCFCLVFFFLFIYLFCSIFFFSIQHAHQLSNEKQNKTKQTKQNKTKQKQKQNKTKQKQKQNKT